MRRFYICLVTALACAVAVVVILTPKTSDKPLIIIYAPPDCAECERWVTYLKWHGFRPVLGPMEGREAIRWELRLPSGFRGQAVATVNGLHIAGFVPVGEIHRLIRGELGRKVIGVAVREGSLPPWKSVTIASRGLTVFAVFPGGMLRPVKVYHGHVEPDPAPYYAAAHRSLFAQ